jgi:hypothetical protein
MCGHCVGMFGCRSGWRRSRRRPGGSSLWSRMRSSARLFSFLLNCFNRVKDLVSNARETLPHRAAGGIPAAIATAINTCFPPLPACCNRLAPLECVPPLAVVASRRLGGSVTVVAAGVTFAPALACSGGGVASLAGRSAHLPGCCRRGFCSELAPAAGVRCWEGVPLGGVCPGCANVAHLWKAQSRANCAIAFLLVATFNKRAD